MTNKDSSKKQETELNPQKIQELQFLEQNIQNLFFQKQSIQAELSEINSALKEIEKSDEDVFKIVGQLMIKSNKENVKKELSDKKKLFDKRIEEIDKQEKTLLKKLEESRKDLF